MGQAGMQPVPVTWIMKARKKAPAWTGAWIVLLETELACQTLSSDGEYDLEVIIVKYNLEIEEYNQLREQYSESDSFRKDLSKEISLICPLDELESNLSEEDLINFNF